MHPYPTPPPVRPQPSGLCIASMILGILGLCNGVTGIPAVICGHLGLSKVKRSGGLLGGGGMAIAGLVLGYLSTAVLLAFAIAIPIAGRSAAAKAREAGEPYDLRAVAVPTMPGRPTMQAIGEKGVTVGAVRISAGNGPGERSWMWVYLPAGEHPAASLPAVLAAPAGTNLVSGSDLGPLTGDDYHEECLPYAEAGMAVVFYSIDGEIDPAKADDVDENRRAYRAFRDADAGLVNARNALEFVLQRMPEVDASRIYSAGHSSAGTLSLLFGEHEPRLAGSLAYAPATDVEARLDDISSDPGAATLYHGLKLFLKRSSPKTHVRHLEKPVFLFHAEGDTVVPPSDSKDFATALEDLGRQVTLETIPGGNHYESMIREGIPAGIRWIESR